MESNSSNKLIILISLASNVLMFVVAFYLLIYVLATGDDPNGRLLSHFATTTLTALPLITYAVLKEKTNVFLLVFYTFYVFVAVFLGASMNFYNQFENINYDKLIHVFFGYTTAVLGLIVLIKTDKLNHSSLFFNLLFLFSFGMMIEAVWEMLEFSMDQLLGSTTQGVPVLGFNGKYLVDVGETMFDIISNFIGVLIFMIQFAVYTKTKKAPIMHFMIRELSK